MIMWGIEKEKNNKTKNSRDGGGDDDGNDDDNGLPSWINSDDDAKKIDVSPAVLVSASASVRDGVNGGGEGESTPLLASRDESDSAASSGGLIGSQPPPPNYPPPPPPEISPLGRGGACVEGEENDEEKASTMSGYGSVHSKGSKSVKSVDDGGDHMSNSDGASTKKKRTKKTKNKQPRPRKQESATAKKKKKKKDGPQKSWCHLLFDAVRILATVASCLMLSMQIVPLIFGDDSTTLQIAVRGYIVIFCISFILLESTPAPLRTLLQNSPFHHWVFRGFFYSFLGVLGSEQNLAIKVEDIASRTSSILGPDYGTLFASVLLDVTSLLMIAVGALYAVLGMLCMQTWYDKMDGEHRAKVEEHKKKKMLMDKNNEEAEWFNE